MKWSAKLDAASIGTRLTAVQVTPSCEVLNTMSLDAQPLRKRQSCQATKTRPVPSTSALGSAIARRSPATVCLLIADAVTDALHDAPPSVERNAAICGPV